MDLKEIGDRLEIDQLIARYCHVLDGGEWDALRTQFAAGASIDYSAFGGPIGDVDAMIAFLQAVGSQAKGTHHLSAGAAVTIDGDSATARSAAQVVLTLPGPDGGELNQFIGLWYSDTLVRTTEGWRFQTRKQERAWMSTEMPGNAGGVA